MYQQRYKLLTLACTLMLAAVFAVSHVLAQSPARSGRLFTADNPNFQYVGRIDFTNPKLPKFWSPGVYIKARFSGTACNLLINDEVLYGKSHNYVEVAIDDQKPYRFQTVGKRMDTEVAHGLSPGAHTVTICKDSESGIGYLEFAGLRCEHLLAPLPLPNRRIAFVGDSITVGTGSDQSFEPCGKGDWYDQQNAYLSYGPTAARALNAQWQLDAVSGIGLLHSCCSMDVTMPDVFDRVNMREATGFIYPLDKYQPDVITITLGQNDGEQVPQQFRNDYTSFLKTLRKDYPEAQLICVSSPMGDQTLTQYFRNNLPLIVQEMNAAGDQKVHYFIYSRSWNDGCGGHPSIQQHQAIAAELTAEIKSVTGWA